VSLFGGPNSEPLSAFLILSMTVSRSFSQAASPGVIGGYVMVDLTYSAALPESRAAELRQQLNGTGVAAR